MKQNTKTVTQPATTSIPLTNENLVSKYKETLDLYNIEYSQGMSGGYGEIVISASAQSELIERIENTDEDGSVMIFDIRSSSDFANGHVTGAISLPFSRMQEQKFQLPKNKHIILYHDGGIDQEQLYTLLTNAKVSKYYLVTEPYTQWKNELSISTGNPREEQ